MLLYCISSGTFASNSIVLRHIGSLPVALNRATSSRVASSGVLSGLFEWCNIYRNVA